MHTFFGVALVLIVSGLVLSWIVRRFRSTLGSQIGLVAGLVARLAAVVALTYVAVDAANRGGWFIALAAFFALIAAYTVLSGALIVWVLWLSLTGRASD
ncbi:MAG: hypothetical protein ACXVY8_01465 [Gaiellaceae bacterium]